MGKKEKATSKKKKSSVTLSRKGLSLWIGVTFFACAWMFVLGIFVGRGTAPVQFNIEKLQNELAALKEAVIKKELDRHKIDSDPEINKAKMGFYETLKKTDQIDKVTKEPPEQKKTSPAQQPVTIAKKTVPSEKVVSVKKEKTTRLEKAPKNNQPFTIQIAALKDPNAAEKLVGRLTKKGYPAYKSIGKIPGKGIWYRVRIGHFNNRAEAGGTLNRLKKEKITAIFVQR